MEPAIAFENVSKRFGRHMDAAERLANALGANIRPNTIRAVDNVSVEVKPGEVLGLVGESGCGKSTLARIAAGILEPSAGDVRIAGEARRAMRGADRRAADLSVQMVFQNPTASLSPRMRVREAVGQAPIRHGLVGRRDLGPFVADLLRRVGLDPSVMYRYPHQFSGGQRARISIARALAVKPAVLICDEATAALDVSVQAQILNLLLDLQTELKLTCIFISHDLGVVRLVADQIGVMYLGRMVEYAPTEALFESPQHPYTRALLADVPNLSPQKRRFAVIKGQLPSPLDPPSGCHFHPRCPVAEKRCGRIAPDLREAAPDHVAACHLVDTTTCL